MSGTNRRATWSLRFNRSSRGRRSSAEDPDVTDTDIRAAGYSLARFTAQEASAVFFGPQAKYNFLSGGVEAGIIDLGTGNVAQPGWIPFNAQSAEKHMV